VTRLPEWLLPDDVDSGPSVGDTFERVEAAEGKLEIVLWLIGRRIVDLDAEVRGWPRL